MLSLKRRRFAPKIQNLPYLRRKIGLNDSLLETKLKLGNSCYHRTIATTCRRYRLPCSSPIATTYRRCRHFPETKLKLVTLPSMRDILVKSTPIATTCRRHRPDWHAHSMPILWCAIRYSTAIATTGCRAIGLIFTPWISVFEDWRMVEPPSL